MQPERLGSLAGSAKGIWGLGYKKIIIKCDQVPSIVEIQNEVIRRREAETIPENSPKGESQSNGDIENAIKQVEGQIRTMKIALESRLQVKIGPGHPILAYCNG